MKRSNALLCILAAAGAVGGWTAIAAFGSVSGALLCFAVGGVAYGLSFLLPPME